MAVLRPAQRGICTIKFPYVCEDSKYGSAEVSDTYKYKYVVTLLSALSFTCVWVLASAYLYILIALDTWSEYVQVRSP